MNTKLLGLTLAGVVAVSAAAQQVSTPYAPQEPAKNVNFKKNGAGDNWFVQLQGGVTETLGFPVSMNGEMYKTGGYSAGLAVGKWHNPYFATRLMFDVNMFHDQADAMNAAFGSVTGLSYNPHFDFIFDLNNYFGVYNASRTFSVRPFLGVGYAATERKMDMGNPGFMDDFRWNYKHTVTANTGVSFDIRLAKRASLNIAPSVAFGYFDNPMNNTEVKRKHMIGQIRAGLTFDLGHRTDFEALEPMDYALINDLNGQINKLRAENAELSKRPARCPECPEVAPAAPVLNVVDNVVFFRLNSARVDRNQLINVYNTAEFVKNHKIAIKVVGYADEKTGTAKYNTSLSEKRAKAVARLLVEKYGVPSELITIDWKGSEQQPYSQNAWNRVVIMKVNK